MHILVPQTRTWEQLSHCGYKNKFSKHTHSTVLSKQTHSASAVILEFPAAAPPIHMCCFYSCVFETRSLRLTPRFPLNDRCEHMLTLGVASSLSLFSMHHSSIHRVWIIALLYGWSVRRKTGTKKRGAHGGGMLSAVTANDMPPCKLWP